MFFCCNGKAYLCEQADLTRAFFKMYFEQIERHSTCFAEETSDPIEILAHLNKTQ